MGNAARSDKGKRCLVSSHRHSGTRPLFVDPSNKLLESCRVSLFAADEGAAKAGKADTGVGGRLLHGSIAGAPGFRKALFEHRGVGRLGERKKIPP
jgi:hypothetical protein